MRVIAGSAKGALLYSPKGLKTRPTKDRCKQKLFDSLLSMAQLPECAIDLFAGSGALGIEALSRGVDKVLFVEKSVSESNIIRKNLVKTHLAQRADLFVTDAFLFLKSILRYQVSLIFADPPYLAGLSNQLLQKLDTHKTLKVGGILVLEESKKVQIHLPVSMELATQKNCGDTMFYFIRQEK